MNFAAGETSKTVQVAITDDTVFEANETVVGSISAASSGIIAVNSAFAVINDNEHWQNNVGAYRLKLSVTDAYDLGEAQ